MGRNNYGLIIFINLMFFQIGLLMSIMSVIIPEIISTFEVGYGMAAVLPFAFYIALGISCVPAGIAGEYFSPKKILTWTFLFALAGILIFVLFLSYRASILSLFIIGSAAAIIQVTTVPLLRRACGAENLAFHSTLNQLMYGAGAFFSPLVYSWLSNNLRMASDEANVFLRTLAMLVPEGFEWAAAYWLFALLVVSLVVIIVFLKFPAREEASAYRLGRRAVYGELFRNKYVIFYFLALVAYASCEQGIAAWLSKFFEDVHGVNPQTEGAMVLSWYWLLLTAGCSIGMLLLKVFDSRTVLGGLTLLAIISLAVALYSSPAVSKVAFPLMAACESVMWPVILSLALNSVARHHEALSGFMFTASIGGALGPLVIGVMGDAVGLQAAMNILFLPLLIVLSVAFWAQPLVKNRTISQQRPATVEQL